MNQLVIIVWRHETCHLEAIVERTNFVFFSETVRPESRKT